MKKVLISDAVDKKSAALLQEAGFSVTYRPGMSPDELSSIIHEYNVLIVRSETEVNASLISRMVNMEIIGRAGAGVDNIDLDAATRKGIIVMNTPGGNTISTAEHTVAMMLSLCRNIPQATQSVREGKWNRKLFKGTELSGKILGVIGLGKVGREVALRCKAFGMDVIGFDPVLSEELTRRMGVKPVELEDLFGLSDIITLHVPLTSDTQNLISKENFKKCKDGVRIINCARGGVVNEKDLLEALKSGKAAGAALDVFENEPPDLSEELVSDHRIIFTPHLGASTGEAQEKVAIQIADQITGYYKTGRIKGGVNADSLLSLSNKEITPFVGIAERIGSLHSQLLKGHLKKINIMLCGGILHESAQVITASVLKGFLGRLTTESTNLINASFLAKEMGVTINEVKASENPTYKHLLSVSCEDEIEKREISGAVFGKSEVRIVEIEGFSVELRPEGEFLVYRNEDKPGVVAAVTEMLASEKINIGSMSLGRNKVQKEALTIISVDSKITPDLIKNISGIDGVKDVHTVSL